MIEIHEIDAAHQADIRLPNEPFPLTGRLIVTRSEEAWHYRVSRNETAGEMCFPDENYDYAAMRAEGTVFLGAYDGERCVGLAILQPGFFKYLYLYDLKVSRACRGQHVGRQLIGHAAQLALRQGYRGLYTQGQDNNLNACLFYLATGFVIGGLDTQVYRGTRQEEKSDILFYLDA